MGSLELIEESLAGIRHLRAAGPVTDEYLRWRDDTEQMLLDLLGPSHAALERYRTVMGPRDATTAEGLQIHGPDGMLARLEAGEAALRSCLGEVE